eukprot:5124936-Pyramimonas_sp.AAC.1
MGGVELTPADGSGALYWHRELTGRWLHRLVVAGRRACLSYFAQHGARRNAGWPAWPAEAW